MDVDHGRMTAQLLTSEIPADVAGWWASEKYDGVRAIWTGTALLTRNGRDLKAPPYFTAGLPRGIRLDGEIWMGRNSFPQLVSTIQTRGSTWAGVEYHVFDVQCAGTFEERQHALSAIDLPPHVFRVHQTQCKGHGHISAMEREVVSIGGEGLVIVRPGSPYRPGRTGYVIKIKRLVADVDRWQG